MLQELADESENQCLKTNKSKTKVISSNDILRRNTGTHHPSKKQASSRTNKDGKAYVKQTKTNIWVREKTMVKKVFEQVRRRKWTWAEHEITD